MTSLLTVLGGALLGAWLVWTFWLRLPVDPIHWVWGALVGAWCGGQWEAHLRATGAWIGRRTAATVSLLWLLWAWIFWRYDEPAVRATLEVLVVASLLLQALMAAE